MNQREISFLGIHINYNSAARNFIIGFSVVVILAAFLVPPINTGDGHEYALTLQAFFDHWSPDLRPEDSNRLLDLVRKYPNRGYIQELIIQIRDSMKQGDPEVVQGIFKAHENQYFGYHFWFYSLMNLPTKILLSTLNINELKSFQLTNSFLMILTIVYLLLVSKQPLFNRFLMTVLYLSGCSFLYWHWSHPELYTAAMIVIASCAFLDRRYRLAILMVALAALQNPSAIFFIPLIIFTWMVKNYDFSTKRHFNKSFLFSLIQLTLIGSIALIPYAFYYYYFGVYNLIANRGFIDSNFIDFDRFFSAIFDLNQGMIIGFPGILTSIIILIIWRLIRTLISKKIAIFEYQDILLLATLVMLMPTLAQTNWNAGQSVFNRYAFWTAMPLLAWLSVSLTLLPKILRYLGLILLVLLQLVPHLLLIDGVLKYQALNRLHTFMNPLAIWVLDNLPGAYQPDPEIFAERVQGHEGFNLNDSPFVYRNQSSEIRQILIAKKRISEISARVCGSTQKLVDSQTNLPVNLSTIRFNKRGWGYLIGRFRCR